MEKGQKSQVDARRRRVQRLKKLIMLSVLVWMILPTGLCIVLFGKIGALNRRLEETQGYLQQMTEDIDRQAQQIQQAQTAPTGSKDILVMAPEGERVEDAAAEPEAAHKVYLTFDDGPSKYTEEILDILDAYDVKATFFVLGKENDYSIEMLQEIANRGHTIGMHSYTHKYADVYRSVEDFAADFYQIYSYILENTGIQSACYRFPGAVPIPSAILICMSLRIFWHSGRLNFMTGMFLPGMAAACCWMWTLWCRIPPPGISRYGTSIILMHDAASRPTTVEALPRIIENILAMEDTVILPITEETTPIHHIK